MSKIRELGKKSAETLKSDGVKGFLVKSRNWAIYNVKKKRMKQEGIKDILFINGCSIDYCARYRVRHKIEELEAFGVTCDAVNDSQITDDLMARYRGFVIYRAPHTQSLEDFVKKAHDNNKVVFYDVDDLIFDLKYTKMIESLKKMPKEELDLYNDGVRRYGKMMQLCDYGITTTKVLAEEMGKYVKGVCVDKNVSSLEMKACSDKAIREVTRNESEVVLGYASGSLTHNEDFEVIKSALIKILKRYDNVRLKLVGALDIPEDLKEFEEKIVITPFVDYTKLPSTIRSFDINLAPLKNTLFNKAKSSIKWMEAGLVEVPTVASDVGDFHDSISNNIDGVLCGDSEWYDKLCHLIEDRELRDRIGEEAHKTVSEKYLTITNGKIISDFILAKLRRNVCFVLPGVTVSGGILVAVKHAILLKKRGIDVTMININKGTAKVKRLECDGDYVNVVPFNKKSFDQRIDIMVATMWLTLPAVLRYEKNNDKRYLVQSRESGFYEMPDHRILESNATYNTDGVKYMTISKWCQKWLRDDFGKKAVYAPNGITSENFPYKRRVLGRKVKILIEGDPASHYKNVDESFRITNKLDRDKYEINFVSYNKEPKKWYKYDYFYNNVNNEEMYKIYQRSDILLKSSVLESFSYPPLEMMATGGYVVVAPNEGNIEYLKNGENCLFYERGKIDEAVEKIKSIVEDEDLRKKLDVGAKKTVESRDWKKIENEVLRLYQ